jgi:hypothetical protein
MLLYKPYTTGAVLTKSVTLMKRSGNYARAAPRSPPLVLPLFIISTISLMIVSLRHTNYG